MGEVSPLVDSPVGALFVADPAATTGALRLRLAAAYGYPVAMANLTFEAGEGVVGQAAASRRTIRVTARTHGLSVRSGLVDSVPIEVVALPVLFEGEPLAVMELGSMIGFSDLHLSFLERIVATLGVALNSIVANRRTEELLAQSQRLTTELREQSAELQRTNRELEQHAALLSDQNRNIEDKNREIELARIGLVEKAQQLARASQYKSEFLANMSHELRTPLNSVLLLARLLAEDPEHNLTSKQVEFAQTIHSAGSDLLGLIEDILDLTKIEAGRVDVIPVEVGFAEVQTYVEQAFGPQAEDKGLDFSVRIHGPGGDGLVTDGQRLQQIIRNLLSNAMKFTNEGSVSLDIREINEHLRPDLPILKSADRVVAFGVTDTGIGIAPEKLAVIFEQFQQADGTMDRKFGGTGLGLSISRELAQLLGGLITVSSEPEVGSTFTLYLPDVLPSDAVTGPAARAVDAPTVPANGSIIKAGRDRSKLATALRRLEGATVMIVDDDVRNVFALTNTLELHGMQVLYADNGAEGVRILDDNPHVDVVLMDAMMPEVDGHETTRIIRRNERFAQIPIIFLTAKARPEDRAAALASGGNDYITKPVDPDELLELMAQWVSKRTGSERRP